MRKFLLLIFVFIMLFVFSGCEDVFGPKFYDVIYKVTGSAITVDVTYANEDGGTSQESDVSVPWSYSFRREEGEFVYISAQNQGESGSVTVRIYKDGSIFKTSTSSGAYVIATASGTL